MSHRGPRHPPPQLTRPHPPPHHPTANDGAAASGGEATGESAAGSTAEGTGNNRRVYVGNLSWSTAWQGLKDHMKQAGEGALIVCVVGVGLGWCVWGYACLRIRQSHAT